VTITYQTLADDTRTVMAPGTLVVLNIGGYACYLTPALLDIYAAASVRYGVPCGALVAQGAQESGFNPTVVSSDFGYGISQWTNEYAARYYLGVPTGDWHPAALDPTKAIPAQASFMYYLTIQYGSTRAALGAYNGGSNWNSVPAAVGYADGVLMRAAQFDAQLAGLPVVAPLAPTPEYSVYRIIVPQYLRAKPDANSARKWLMISAWECQALGPVLPEWLLCVDLTGKKVGYIQRNHIVSESRTLPLPSATPAAIRALLAAGTLDTSYIAF